MNTAWFRFILFCLVGGVPLAAPGEEVVDSVCAVVDDQIILGSDVAEGVSILLLENKIRYPTAEQIDELRRRVLSSLIDQKVLLAQAVEESLEVEDRVVHRELERKLRDLTSQVGGEQALVDYFKKPLRLVKRELEANVRRQLLVEMLRQRHLADVHVRRREVVNFYETHADELPGLPDRVDISHILLKLRVSEQSRQRAMEEMTEIKRLLDEGADFDSLARARSQDPSARLGGRLGFTDRGDLVPEYEEAAYGLEPGGISDIVETKYGLHIIRLLDRQGERISTQHILIKLEPSSDDLQRVLERARKLRVRLLAGESFAAIAARYSEDPETASDGGRLEEVNVADLPAEIRDAVGALSPGEVSPPVEGAFGVHIIRLDRRYPARKLTLEQDWQTIERFALNDKRGRVFQEWVENLKRDHYIRAPW